MYFRLIAMSENGEELVTYDILDKVKHISFNPPISDEKDRCYSVLIHANMETIREDL
jgi:hypothetical protein